MNIHQLENWGRHIVEVLLSGRPVEDDRVEIKATWVDEADPARRLAAHANVANAPEIRLMNAQLEFMVSQNNSGFGSQEKDKFNWKNRSDDIRHTKVS